MRHRPRSVRVRRPFARVGRLESRQGGAIRYRSAIVEPRRAQTDNDVSMLATCPIKSAAVRQTPIRRLVTARSTRMHRRVRTVVAARGQQIREEGSRGARPRLRSWVHHHCGTIISQGPCCLKRYVPAARRPSGTPNPVPCDRTTRDEVLGLWRVSWRNSGDCSRRVEVCKRLQSLCLRSS
jgi:hypothetical protein